MQYKQYKVIVWDNDGQRSEHGVDTLADALAYARFCRSLRNRTVKVGDRGDSIRHWSRTIGARRNHWATHSTAECSRSHGDATGLYHDRPPTTGEIIPGQSRRVPSS